MPRFDSASVFGAILDRQAGRFRFGPKGVTAPLSRRYEPGSLVLETTWWTDTGWLVVRDALTVAEWSPSGDGTGAEPSHEADATLVRVATCTEGEVELDLRCDPAFDYGREAAVWRPVTEGEAEAGEGHSRLRLATDLDLALEGSQANGNLRLRVGDSAFAAVSWGAGIEEHPRSAPEAFERLESTRRTWRHWLGQGSFPDHPWRIHLQRSALVLKGLTYGPTGAVVAAATTSLPENPGGARNWDYRYSWIRDSTFALWAMHSLGFDREGRDFMGFVRDRALESDGSLQIMYGIGGERDLTERTLDHLSGYGGARPVRTGNGAFDQRQNDVWGALLDSLYVHRKAMRPDEMDPRVRTLIRKAVENAISAWPEPDQGIWESRGRPKHYVSSKLMIWVAVDRGARLARQGGNEELAARWEGTATEIKREILERGLRDGVFRQHYETDALDASVLLMPLVRFLPHDDPRIVETVLAVRDGLAENGYIRRYVPDETDDGVGGDEATFLICSFWMVSALSEIGEPDAARRLCERLLGVAGSLGLYAEELAHDSHRQLGNFFQAFTHLALINAVSHVIQDELRARREGSPTAVFTEMRD